MFEYDVVKAIKRIDNKNKEKILTDVSFHIPSDKHTNNNIYFFYGTALSIRFNIKERLIEPEKEESIIIKWYNLFVSETYEIVKSNMSFRDFMVLQNEVIVIYNTSLKHEMDKLIEDMGRINTLIKIINKKLNIDNERTNISLAACYDKMLMYKITDNKYYWKGDNIEKASSLSLNNDKKNMIVNRPIWTNLFEDNQKMFERMDSKHELYCGSIINIALNNMLYNK